MRIYLNVGHIQFNLYIAGSAELIIGKMVHADEDGCQIELESDGTLHAYSWSVIQHATAAP